MFKFIEKLQNSDEDTKKKWMFVLTSISMAVVIFIWLGYFNNLVTGLSTPKTEELSKDAGFSFIESAKMSAVVVYGGLVDKIYGLGNILKAPREYIINPPK